MAVEYRDIIAKNRKAARTSARLRAARKASRDAQARADVIFIYGIQTEAEMSAEDVKKAQRVSKD